MVKIQKFLIIFSLCLGTLFLTAFSSEQFLSKLKSLSYIIRLIENYYVEEVELDTIIDGAIHGLLEELDPHSQYIPPKESSFMNETIEGEFEGIGIEFAIIDGYITVISPIPGTPSDRAGLIGGDKFIKINQESAYKITQDEVFDKLRGPKGSSVNITVQRVGQEFPFEVTLIRDKIPIHSVMAALIYKDDVGYIKVNRFAKNTFVELKTAVDSLEGRGMKNLVLDLRNNGGGLMDQAISIVDLFINSNDTILFTKGRISDANEVFYAQKYDDNKNFPIIALINRSSASASEIVSGALQDLDRGLVIGETSFGKGLVQRQFMLDDGAITRITIAKYYTPSGRMIQRSYNEGLDEYYANLGEKNREASDSSLTNRPIFKTKKGRDVFGGGGITPDIHVSSINKINENIQKILSHPSRLPFKYANKIKSNFDKKGDTFDNFNISKHSIDINQFILFITKEDSLLALSSEDIKEDWSYVENRILANVASIVWGKDYYYNILLNQDIQFQKALESFDQAKKIME